jgi:hypothetical protein
MPKLGTLRAVYAHVYDEIGENDSKTETDICRDGDKYEFAIDGIIVNFDAKEDAGLLDSEILIDFSIYPTEKADDLLVDFPYSLRGTRQNPKYIPLSKETGFPMLPKNKKWYYKIKNTNAVAAHAIQGVAIAILGYPVFGE